MFHFKFLLTTSLPKLAWCACLVYGDDEIVVEHGDWVETHSAFFVEGAWDAPFEYGAIDDAGIVLGSGARLGPTGVVFSTTTHTMERLQSVRVDNKLFISNSFAYLLTATNDNVDVNYRYYERDFMTFLQGRENAKHEVPTEAARSIRLHYGERIFISVDLELRTKPFPPCRHFASYEEYVSNVAATVARIHENAASLFRHIRYTPISTISSGYDSPACTVFARQIGCRAAITILDARADYAPDGHAPKDTSDTGAQIAKYLQIDISAFHRGAYLQRDDFPEAEFIATGNGGDDVVFCVAEQSLAAKMVFTGFLGDTLWGQEALSGIASRNYVFKFPAGGSLGEFRLRVGFIHVPVPLLTYPSQPDLVRITKSADMAPWRVGGSYDRPIPRRLVEDSGVPRSIFAREKKAISQPLWASTNSDHTRAMMSVASWESLVRYVGSEWVLSRLSISARWRALTARVMMFAASPRLDWYIQKVGRMAKIKWLHGFQVDRFSAAAVFSSPVGLKFHWAITQVSGRYRHTRYASRCARRIPPEGGNGTSLTAC